MAGRSLRRAYARAQAGLTRSRCYSGSRHGSQYGISRSSTPCCYRPAVRECGEIREGLRGKGAGRDELHPFPIPNLPITRNGAILTHIAGYNLAARRWRAAATANRSVLTGWSFRPKTSFRAEREARARRVFSSDEDQPGAAPVIVLSNGFVAASL